MSQTLEKRTRLIVNADDFGLAECVNRGIIEAYRAGAITSVSLLACGRAFEHAVELTREHPGLDVGVHLCLDEESSLLPPERIPSLVDGRGRFLGRGTLLRRLLIQRRINLDEVRDEFTAQVRRCVEAGVKIQHFDGHGHVHVYPGIAAIAVDVAGEFGIQCCRNPSEAMLFLGTRFRPQSYLNKCIVATFARASRGAFRRAGIVFPDVFLGMSYGGRLTPPLVRYLVDRMPAGKVIELMTHPGHFDAEQLARYHHWNYDWEGELEAVLSLPGHFENNDCLEPVSFADLAPSRLGV